MDINLILELIDRIGNSDYKLCVYDIKDLAVYSADGNNTLGYCPNSENGWQDCIDWMKKNG